MEPYPPTDVMVDTLHHYHHVGRFLVRRFLHPHFQPPSLPSTAHGSQKRDRGEHPNSMLSKSRSLVRSRFQWQFGCIPYRMPTTLLQKGPPGGTKLRNVSTASYLATINAHNLLTTRKLATCAAPIASRDAIRERRKLSKGGGRYRLWRYATKRKRQNKNKNNNTTNLLLGGGSRREGIV